VASSYLGRDQGSLVELRLTYYGRAHHWDFTPGQPVGRRQSRLVGRFVTPREAARCFVCHATAVVADGGNVKPEASLLGIGCEACHGPGAGHVAAVKRGDRDLRMPKLARLRDRISLELCGQCHRTPAARAMAPEAAVSQLARFQGLALARSACFRGSQGRLSCITCHDPHRDANRTSHAEYDATCRSCHDPKDEHRTPNAWTRGAGTPRTPHLVCKRAPAGDCVSCHMPEQPVDMPTEPRFRTHWIRVWNDPAERIDNSTREPIKE